MFSRRLKTGYFVLEGLNSFATVSYFYYLYFFMQQQFGFGNQANLLLAALNGGTYAACSWWAGKFATRRGYFTALKLGFTIMPAALVVGSLFQKSAPIQIAVMFLTVFGMCFTWPTLEALISESEESAGLQHMIGVYNVVWAATGAVAYFCGGAILDRFGLSSLFYVPIAMQVAQLGLTFWLETQIGPLRPAIHSPVPAPHGTSGLPTPTEEAQPPFRRRTFLRMAWLANPCAYIGIQTLVAAMPGVAGRLELSKTLAGFCCSLWCFARLGAFVALWLWDGWHYRFAWLLASFCGLVLSFAAILMAPNLLVLLLAQVFFGGAIGLIYCSSLYYSMHGSDAKSEHGGFHEAAIGVGNFAGPAVGATSLYLLPQYANSGTVAVSCLLLCGLGGLVAIWRSAD